MEKIIDVAEYMINAYKNITGDTIGETKLHKLLYFAQRESFAVTGQPMFIGDMQGWKRGPVSPEVRDALRGMQIPEANEISDDTAYIVNNVIFEYGFLPATRLSILSHEEKSWMNARIGLRPDENGTRALSLDDIREDAKKVRPYDHVWDMYYDEFEDAPQEDTGVDC